MLDIFSKRLDPKLFKATVAISNFKECIILQCDEDLIDIIDDLSQFLELLDNHKDIPKTLGIYRCNIKVESYTSNHPQDPTEWDMSITAQDFQKLNIEF